MRIKVPEGMTAARFTLRALDTAALESICDVLQEQGVEGIAVCYFHAYANPAHEIATAELLRDRLPQVPVTLFYRVAPALHPCRIRHQTLRGKVLRLSPDQLAAVAFLPTALLVIGCVWIHVFELPMHVNHRAHVFLQRYSSSDDVVMSRPIVRN